jgi:hypothetical protein
MGRWLLSHQQQLAGLLSKQQQSYQLLLAAPPLIFHSQLSCRCTYTCEIVQVYGIYWLLVATASYRLSLAAENGNLSSLTYQRLNAFLGLFSITSAIPLLRGALGGELSPAPAAAAAAVLAAAAVSTYFPAYLRSGGSTDVAAAAAGFGDALKSTFKAGRGWTGAFYSLSFWETFILGVALVGGDSFSEPKHPGFKPQKDMMWLTKWRCLNSSHLEESWTSCQMAGS